MNYLVERENGKNYLFKVTLNKLEQISFTEIVYEKDIPEELICMSKVEKREQKYYVTLEKTLSYRIYNNKIKFPRSKKGDKIYINNYENYQYLVNIGTEDLQEQEVLWDIQLARLLSKLNILPQTVYFVVSNVTEDYLDMELNLGTILDNKTEGKYYLIDDIYNKTDKLKKKISGNFYVNEKKQSLTSYTEQLPIGEYLFYKEIYIEELKKGSILKYIKNSYKTG